MAELTPDEICEKLRLWSEAADISSPRAGGGGLAIYKSDLLARLMYGGEKGPSQTPCPVHEGHWQGINLGWPGQIWSNGKPVEVSPMLQEYYDAGCRCFQHRGSSATTGWQPDVNCCLECEHEWVSARNEFVLSGEVCLKCSAIRAEPDK